MSFKSRAPKSFPDTDLPDPEKEEVMSGGFTYESPMAMGKDDYVVPVTAADSVPLVGILGSASDAAYTDNAKYLKYDGYLATTAKINGNEETSCKNIQYCVAAKDKDGNIARYGKDHIVLEDAIKVSDILQSDITHASVRNSALPKTFKTMGLCGVLERLGKGIAKYAMYGTLTPAELRGGGTVNVRAISASTDNIAVGAGNVFVTKRATERISPAVDCALFNAISGEGATAYTDLLSIDGNGVAEVPTASGATLAAGCFHAANQIFRQYIQCGEGPAASFAFFKGINSIITLTAHSDEGGYVRQVFRRGRYTTPNGAVLLSRDSTEYTGLPCPGGGVQSYRRLAHSILLGCAAGVANSDPMVNMGGRMYPTLLAMTGGDNDDPGVDPIKETGPEASVVKHMQSKWASVAGDWARNYAYYVGTLFGAPGSTKSVVGAITAMANDMIGSDDKHLAMHVAVAFCWVEPTSITPFWDSSLVAMVNDCGALAVEGIERTVPFIRDAVIETKTGDRNTTMLTKFGYMRRHGLVVHLTGNKLDGMASIRLYSGSGDKFANVGGAGAMNTRIGNGDSLDTFQWGRCHNQIVAVGEFVEVNNVLRLSFEHYTVGEKPWDIENTHVPGSHEFVGGKVTYRTSRPYAEPDPTDLVKDSRSWIRARSAAVKAIAVAKLRSGAESSAFGANIRPVVGDPIMIGAGIGIEDPISRYFDNVNTVPIIMDDVAQTESAQEASVDRGGVTYAKGVAVQLVIHNVADKGRKAPRPTVASGGGSSGRTAAASAPVMSPEVLAAGTAPTMADDDVGPGTAVI